jgi:hypothetical protein
MHDLAIRRPSVIDEFRRDISAPTLPAWPATIGGTLPDPTGVRGVLIDRTLLFGTEARTRLDEDRKRVDAFGLTIAMPAPTAGK